MKAVCLLLAVVASVAFAANTDPCAGVAVDTYAPINPPYSWDPQSANPLGYQRGRIYEGEHWASPAAWSGLLTLFRVAENRPPMCINVNTVAQRKIEIMVRPQFSLHLSHLCAQSTATLSALRSRP